MFSFIQSRNITFVDDTATLVAGVGGSVGTGWEFGTGNILGVGTGDEAEGRLQGGDGDDWPNSESNWVFVSLLVESVKRMVWDR